MKTNKILFLCMLLVGCVQEPADIVYKGIAVPYNDNYVESPDGKIARSLRGYNNAEESQKETIVKKELLDKKGFHIVKSGESLWSIARDNDMTAKDLADLNKIKKPYRIYIGQELRINGVSGKTSAKNEKNEKKEVQKEIQREPKQLKKTNDDNNEEPVIQISNKDNRFVWPIKGKIVSSFGNKKNGLVNDGMNISAAKGANFVAAEDGVIAYVGNELRGYGNIILIKHSNNWISAYAHCDEITVAKGDKVKRGQVIGKVGETGNVNAPQLYFSLRKGREAVDPMKHL
ncbi:MAG: hypothetical protein Ta2D_04650 [Rickettsiales bacterium]|nr:MAG: hypothetical protein Ta2D_04650 [Rickettsiales bacterium]